MSIISKISDVLKEVFWLKPSAKSRKVKKAPAAKKAPKKKIAKKIIKKKLVVKKPVTKVIVKAPAPIKAVKVPKLKEPAIDPNLALIGEVTHYFDRIKVCVVKINSGTVLIGDRLSIIGPKTKFVQKVWSMQIESQDVKVARKGQSIGLKVEKLVVIGDKVYK